MFFWVLNSLQAIRAMMIVVQEWGTSFFFLNHHSNIYGWTFLGFHNLPCLSTLTSQHLLFYIALDRAVFWEVLFNSIVEHTNVIHDPMQATFLYV